MKKQRHTPLSHYGTTTWRKPLKPVKQVEESAEPEQKPGLVTFDNDSWVKGWVPTTVHDDIVEVKNPCAEVYTYTYDNKLAKAAKYWLQYGGASWTWRTTSETMRDRAYRLRSEKGKAPRVDLMVEFAEQETERVRKELDSKNNHLKSTIWSQGDQIVTLTNELAALKVALAEERKKTSYVQRIAESMRTLPVGRVFRED